VIPQDLVFMGLLQSFSNYVTVAYCEYITAHPVPSKTAPSEAAFDKGLLLDGRKYREAVFACQGIYDFEKQGLAIKVIIATKKLE
jgi:hypothetical protein